MERGLFKFKLGIFVIAATVLLVAVAFVLSGPRWRTARHPAYTTLSESVQGLEVGAAVKFRGVPIGSVRNILVQENKLVRVDMELYEDSIRVPGRTMLDFLTEQVQLGYRCRLELTGITGLRYIEIDQFAEDDDQDVPPPPAAEHGPLYIPSVRSLFAGVTTDLSFTLAKLAQVDYAKIGRNVGELVETANTYLQDERLAGLVANFAETGEQLAGISRTLNRSDIGAALMQVREALDNIDAMVAALHGAVREADLPGLAHQARSTLTGYEQLPDDLAAALREAQDGFQGLRDAAEDAKAVLAASQIPETSRQLRRTLSDLRMNVADTAARLNQTLDALGRIAELLELEPESLLHGKQTPPVHMGPAR